MTDPCGRRHLPVSTADINLVLLFGVQPRVPPASSRNASDVPTPEEAALAGCKAKGEVDDQGGRRWTLDVSRKLSASPARSARKRKR